MNEEPIIVEQDEDGDWVLADDQENRLDEIIARILDRQQPAKEEQTTDNDKQPESQ